MIIMTCKEAKEMLENERLMTFYRYPALDSAVELAIESLEKQIPEKPQVSKCNTFTDFHCPNCKNLIAIEDEHDIFYGWKSKYCDHCGQALDWSEK